ncbi:MAG: hypothetical protein HeimC2_18140 [Candidatus Heimdallarchaeota archaeon LC_2]|nr:MAG: hypothetical protein HeimC2_18140 [Candidatus Heimdallarchaeota archaeon LC_2]
MTDRAVLNIILDNEFEDRFQKEPNKAVDVILPLLNSNPLLYKCIQNFYKRVPINRLLVGDGGCTDDSISVLKQFPRVEIFDHTEFVSQGFSIKKLIEACETEYMIYFHADVFLEEKWFDVMYANREKNPWFESGRKMVTLIVWDPKHDQNERAYSGSQFGLSSALKKVAEKIDDDFLQRNEDLIIAELVGMENYTKVTETFHYHQMLSKRGEKEPPMLLDFIPPKIRRKDDPVWEKRIYTMQWKGLVKYCEPNGYLRNGVRSSIKILRKLNAFEDEKEKEWVNNTNPVWFDIIWGRTNISDVLRKLINKVF